MQELSHKFEALESLRSIAVTKSSKKKTAPLLTPSFRENSDDLSVYLLDLFLPNPASPASPAPNRSMVAGSGTAPVDTNSPETDSV